MLLTVTNKLTWEITLVQKIIVITTPDRNRDLVYAIFTHDRGTLSISCAALRLLALVL